jgi:hypothetical protein
MLLIVSLAIGSRVRNYQDGTREWPPTAGRTGDIMIRRVGFSVAAVVIILLGLGIFKWATEKFTVELPQYPQAANTVWLDQN